MTVPCVMKLVVIGNGMVGHRLLEQLEAGPGAFEISVLCEEPRPAYDRVHLTSFFSGKTAEDLSLVEPGFFERAGIGLSLSERAVVHRSRAAPRSHLPGPGAFLRSAGPRNGLLSLRAAHPGK